MFLSQTADQAGRSVGGKSLIWRPVGRRDWKTGLPDAQGCIGHYQFGWRDKTGATRAFVSVRLMPQTVEIGLSDKGDGELEFHAGGLPGGTIVSLAGQVSGQVDDDGHISLRLQETVVQLGRIKVHFRPPEGAGRAFDATLPRPGKQGYFIDAEDRLLRHDMVMDLGQLAGWRVFAPPGQDAELRIRLHADNAPKHPISILVQNDTSLGSLLPLFRGLIAIGGPDSELRLRVLVGTSESHRITLRRYQRALEWDGTSFEAGTAKLLGDFGKMEAQVINLAAPGLSDAISELRPGEDIVPLLPNHPGPWMVFAWDADGLIRPPRPISKAVASDAVQAPRFSDVMLECGQFPRRPQRIEAFGKVLRSLVEPMRIGDLSLYEQQIDDLADGEALSSLDGVVALAQAPELAALLLLRAKPDVLAARFELETVSPFSWTTLPLVAWQGAIRVHRSTLVTQMTNNGIDEGAAQSFAEMALVNRLREILDRRPEIAGQIVMAASAADLIGALVARFTPPPGLGVPEKALLEAARRAIVRHDAGEQAFRLKSDFAPPEFKEFYDPMRGLLDAPLIAAEHVLGLRSHPPDTDTAVALLHYRRHDPDYFETAMPPAIAYINKRIN